MDLCCLSKEAAPRPASELVELLGSLIERGTVTQGSQAISRHLWTDPLSVLCSATETTFHVKMLPRARIPIIKLTMPPTPTVPFGMACDIGFENRLALENTRLLLTYAMIDSRLRIVVLFRECSLFARAGPVPGFICMNTQLTPLHLVCTVKVWTKRRKINNPYRGTLSSYGFVLLVIHFLAQVKTPAVLP